MASVRETKITIGRESVAGTIAARTKVLPWRGDTIPGLDSAPTKEADQVGTGKNMSQGNVLQFLNVAGTLPLSPRAVPAYGSAWESNVGGAKTPVQLGAVIRVKYTGASASCKLVADSVAQELKSFVGALGSETADATFGIAGVIDLTLVGNDTAGELVSTINSYGDYSAELVNGLSSASCVNIEDDERQAKERWVDLFHPGTTGNYHFRFEVDNGATERLTLSVQIDKRVKNMLYNGINFNSMVLDGSNQAQVTGDGDVLGFREYDNHIQACETFSSTTVTVADSGRLFVGMQVTGSGIPASTTVASIVSDTSITISNAATASATVDLTFSVAASTLELEDAAPLIFWKGDTQIGGENYKCSIQQNTITTNNNGREDGTCQGSPYRGIHQKGEFVADIAWTLRVYEDAQYYLRDLKKAEFSNLENTVGMSAYYKGANLSDGLKEMLICTCPFVDVLDYTFTDDNGIYGANVTAQAVDPPDNKYDSPFIIDIIMPYSSLG